jgi:hypothetical protein
MRRDIAFPTLHAWVMDDTRGIIDTTWRDPEQCEYIGIVFSEAELTDQLLANKVYGILDPGMINVKLLRKLDAGLLDSLLPKKHGMRT